MRRDVGAVESAERRLQRAAAGVRRRPFFLLGVTAEAAAGFRQIFAALRIALGEARGSREKKEKPRDGGASSHHLLIASGGSLRGRRRRPCPPRRTAASRPLRPSRARSGRAWRSRFAAA